MKKIQPYLSLAMTIITGLVFVASAVLKMQSINSFELYIFSFEIFSLNTSALLARAVIGVELALGLAYLTNLYHKELFYALLTSLLGFTIFLITIMVIGREDNCHCFGDLVDISPLESIFKNLALIAALFISRGTPAWRNPKVVALSSYAMLMICAIGLYPMMKYPPRGLVSLVRGQSQGGVGNVDVELFESFLSENEQLRWGEQTRVIIYYGVRCKYCKLAAQQLSHIVKRNNLSSENFAIFFWGAEEEAASFMEQNGLTNFKYTIISPKVLLDITSGEIPTIVVYDQSSEHQFSTVTLDNIDERKFVENLK